MELKKSFFTCCMMVTLLCTTYKTIDASVGVVEWKQELTEMAFQIVVRTAVPLAGVFMGYPLIKSKIKKKHSAPDYVQEKAKKFFQMLAKSRYDRFSCWLKKKLGYLNIYQGARKEFFANDQDCSAASNLYYGIDFPTDEFSGDSLTNKQLGTLCHEVVHVFYGDTYGRYEQGSKKWYRGEYRADYKTVELLYELGLYEAIELRVVRRSNEAICGYMQEVHPYAFGTIDGFYNLFKDQPEKISHLETASIILDQLKNQKFEEESWQERYEVYNKKKQENEKSQKAF